MLLFATAETARLEKVHTPEGPRHLGTPDPCTRDQGVLALGQLVERDRDFAFSPHL